MSIRTAAFAGQFYPKNSKQLESQLEEFFSNCKIKRDCGAIISPHAGYVYSGQTAAKAFSCLKKAATYIILGPNHTGLGSAISIDKNDFWETPLGRIEVDKKIAEKIIEKSDAEFDELAHIGEHSIEVQIPFLQHLFKEEKQKPKIVPIIISEDNHESIKKLGKILAEIGKNEDIAVIASSDFSHFISEKLARKVDFEAIHYITKIDPEGFHSEVNKHNLSICGYLPITCLLYYCMQKGLNNAEIEGYTTSGSLTGDYDNVVAYCAISFKNGKNSKN
ncbi:MAG: AmmeMemoRadiSam system protein B [archaeon]